MNFQDTTATQESTFILEWNTCANKQRFHRQVFFSLEKAREWKARLQDVFLCRLTEKIESVEFIDHTAE